MNGLIIYLAIGVAWGLLNESHIQSNGHRARLIFLWPFTLGAFMIGIIEAYRNNKDDDYDEEM